MSNLENISRITADIAKDMADDAARFEGQPFTGRNVATYFGNHGAAIAALANMVKELSREVEQLRNYCPEDNTKM